MSDSIFEIKLKQHTPIIHFQPNQKGATLRASDVKPRLDKYLNAEILKKYYDPALITPELEKIITEQSIRMKKKKSSLYQIEIDSSDPISLPITREGKGDRSLYFGDIIKEMILYKKNFLIVKSFYSEMIKAVKLAASLMFYFENFGTRQNKGYGSYSVVGSDIEVNFKKMSKDSVYYFDIVKENRNENEEDILYKLIKKIFYFYNTVKGGVNEDLYKKEKAKYSKSLLFKYLKNRNPDLIWEKRLFKLELGNSADFDSVKNNKNTMLVRHVLGLADTYNFTKKNDVRMDTEDYPPRTGKKINNDLINIDRNYRYQLELDNNPFERIASPIFIKPIKTANGYRVYIILKTELLLNENSNFITPTFAVTKKVQSGKDFPKMAEFNNRTGSYTLKCINNFDLIDFFKEGVYKVFYKQNPPTVMINKFVQDIKLEKLI